MYNTARLLDSYREASEDRAEFVVVSETTLVLIVADGVGGRENGGNAASLAVKLTWEVVSRATTRELSDTHFWQQTFHYVDESVSDDSVCGETTLVAICLTPTRIVGACVGDSETWWINPSGTIQVLTEGGCKPYLGRGMASPTTFTFPTPQAGTLLVATDGLFKYTDAEQIARTVVGGGTDLQTIAAALRDQVRSSSGVLYDDFAVLLAASTEAEPVPQTIIDRFTGFLRSGKSV